MTSIVKQDSKKVLDSLSPNVSTQTNDQISLSVSLSGDHDHETGRSKSSQTLSTRITDDVGNLTLNRTKSEIDHEQELVCFYFNLFWLRWCRFTYYLIYCVIFLLSIDWNVD